MKEWILLFSLRSPQRSPDGKLTLQFDCRKKNNAQSSPRRVLFRRRLRGGKKRIRHNHHTRACLRLSNQENTNAARASSAAPEDEPSPRTPRHHLARVFKLARFPTERLSPRDPLIGRRCRSLGCVCSIEIQWRG